jgi:hypothetical protein
MLNDQLFMALLSFVLIGALFGFLEHNLSKEQKLFMGDSGSLFTGFLLAYLIVEFLNFNLTSESVYRLENAPIIALAIIAYPLFDTLRIFTVRIRQGRSPFSADKNHIHHRWLAIGLTHRAASFVIVLSSILVVVIAVMLKSLNVHVQLVLCVSLGVISFLVPFKISVLNSNKTSGIGDHKTANANAKKQNIFAFSTTNDVDDVSLEWSNTALKEEEKLYNEIKQRKTAKKEGSLTE